MGGIERRRLGEREDPPGAGLHDHRGAVVGLDLADLRRAGLLRLVLNVSLDGEPHVAARRHRLCLVLTQGDRLAGGSDLELTTAVLARQHRVVGLLDAGLAAQVSGTADIREADDVGGEIPVGVGAGVRGRHDDARLVERCDAGPDGR
jgi:hypothetical protein